jgi:hypothetical protein
MLVLLLKNGSLFKLSFIHEQLPKYFWGGEIIHDAFENVNDFLSDVLFNSIKKDYKYFYQT